MLETWWSHHSFCSNVETETAMDAGGPFDQCLQLWKGAPFPLSFTSEDVFHGVVGDRLKKWCFFFHFFNGDFWHVVVKDGHRTSQQLIVWGWWFEKYGMVVLFTDNDAVLMGFYQEDGPPKFIARTKKRAFGELPRVYLWIRKSLFSASNKASELLLYTLQGTNISPKNGILKMIFLFPRWDMLIPWRVYIIFFCFLFLEC